MDLKDKVKEIWGRMSTGMKVVAVAVVVMVLFAAAASADKLVEGAEPRETLTHDGYSVDIYPADTICLPDEEASDRIVERGGVFIKETIGVVVGDEFAVPLYLFEYPETGTGEAWTIHTEDANEMCLRTYVYKGTPS